MKNLSEIHNPLKLKEGDYAIYEDNEVEIEEFINELCVEIRLTGEKAAESRKHGVTSTRIVSIYNLEKSNDTFRLQKAQEKIKILNEKIKVLTEENNRSFWNKLFKRKK